VGGKPSKNNRKKWSAKKRERTSARNGVKHIVANGKVIAILNIDGIVADGLEIVASDHAAVCMRLHRVLESEKAIMLVSGRGT
jgi:hypothetical protein